MPAELTFGLATLLLGGFALYVSRSQAKSERDAAVHSAFVAISEAFINFPSIRPIFYEDEDAADDGLPGLEDAETRLRANSVAELLMDTLEMARERRHTRTTYDEYTALVFERSRFMTEWAISHESLYPKELVAFAVVAKRDRSDDAAQLDS